VTDETGINWENVLHEREPDTSDLRLQIERLTDWIRRFARAAGVVAADLLSLPW
jgi:hypothetical protein